MKAARYCHPACGREQAEAVASRPALLSGPGRHNATRHDGSNHARRLVHSASISAGVPKSSAAVPKNENGRAVCAPARASRRPFCGLFGPEGLRNAICSGRPP